MTDWPRYLLPVETARSVPVWYVMYHPGKSDAAGSRAVPLAA